MTHSESIIVLDNIIESINIKGHCVRLNASITLEGQLDTTKLADDIKTNKNAEPVQPSLQIGVDEAGRGPLLGCVTVAAVILPSIGSGLIEQQLLKDTPLSILTDSKKLSEKKRDILYPLVQQYALGFVVAEIPAGVIDQINILQATMLGMRLCSEALLKAIAKHSIKVLKDDHSEYVDLQVALLFDGNRCPDLDYSMLDELGVSQSIIDCQPWIKGDARHTSIAAASILAKVSRDKTMYEMDSLYPHYAIAKHKGYPTQAHIKVIAVHGILPEHRRSFSPIKKAYDILED